jgi:large subunit ribosomal protein L24
MSNPKMKIKKGDTVKILSGKDKGKTGTVLRAMPSIGKVVVDNINMHTKFQKGKTARQASQRITFPGSMYVSKVMLIDSNSGKPSRVGYQTLENGTKQRMAKKSGKAI